MTAAMLRFGVGFLKCPISLYEAGFVSRGADVLILLNRFVTTAAARCGAVQGC